MFFFLIAFSSLGLAICLGSILYISRSEWSPDVDLVEAWRKARTSFAIGAVLFVLSGAAAVAMWLETHPN